jgi:hypothetical protein
MADNTKEYVVTLYRHEDLDDFYEDMETPGGNLYIPGRRIEVSNRRPLSRNTHYYLNPEEALQVKNDPRVWDIISLEDIPPPIPAWLENTSFNKNPSSGVDRNWALKRVIEGNNQQDWFSSNYFNSNQPGYVFASSEGLGVDVVIFKSSNLILT